MFERASRWRYHAYEWVLNDESWYDTSTDNNQTGRCLPQNTKRDLLQILQ